MASDKAQYVVALIAEFAKHYGITTVEAAKYLSQYKALDLFDRQYGYLHTQSFASNVRDLSAYFAEWEVRYDYALSRLQCTDYRH